jgi:hypothetical protein
MNLTERGFRLLRGREEAMPTAGIGESEEQRGGTVRFAWRAACTMQSGTARHGTSSVLPSVRQHALRLLYTSGRSGGRERDFKRQRQCSGRIACRAAGIVPTKRKATPGRKPTQEAPPLPKVGDCCMEHTVQNIQRYWVGECRRGQPGWLEGGRAAVCYIYFTSGLYSQY